MKIYTYEDRKSDSVGIQLLVLSVQRHCPGLDVDVTFPDAPADLVLWFEGRHGAALRTAWSGGATRNGWNIKPHLLLSALESGEKEPIWLDSDIMLTADFRPLLSGIEENTVVVAEDYFGAPLQGGITRTTDWHLQVGRKLRDTVNSCIVRVTNAHRVLLEHWDALMLTDSYRQAQSMHWSKRPLHMIGDQDVLSALLGAKEYADVPIRWIRRGVDVAHCNQYGGYRAHEQLYNLIRHHTPTLLHGQGEKAWRPYKKRTVHLELSPYTLEALKYVGELKPSTTWAEPTLSLSRLLRVLAPEQCSALWPAIAHELRHQRVFKTVLKRVLGRP